MIPSPGCDPKINIVVLGGEILKSLSNGGLGIEEIMEQCAKANKVSIDHIILSLDWLFMISAIKYNQDMVFLNAAD